MSKKFKGQCVCGQVSFVAGPLKPLWYCHCDQCRTMTGHYMAAAQTGLSDIEITGEPRWYYVTQKSRYGFCPNCGSQLFWRNDDEEYMSVTGGSLDDASGLAVGGHIFTGEKGKYYKLPEHESKYIKYWKDPPK